ncbi:MAG: hypothetical protein ABSF98_28825 [Bryobacteraceae bacterium]|jgi:hypothetical protein
MNVGAVGGGASAAAPDPLRTGGIPGQSRAAATPATPATPGDSVASFLATGRVADLLAGVDQRRPIQSPEVIAELLRAAVSAADEGNFVRALEKVRELVAMDPERADTLASEPELDSIRAEVSQLLRDLAAAARSDAEQKLTGAHQALDSNGDRLPEADRADLRAVLSVAVQLFETERHANYLRAGDLADVVADVIMMQCGWTPAGVPVWVPVEVSGAVREPGPWENLWRRASPPTLVLAWLALGIASALPFTVVHVAWPVAAFALGVWGIGFVVLVRRYRRARRRREREKKEQAAMIRAGTSVP